MTQNCSLWLLLTILMPQGTLMQICMRLPIYLTFSTSGAYERETVHRFGKNTSGGTGHFSGIHIGAQHEEPDPFKIRTLLDNMKQMVAADIPMEKPYEWVRFFLYYQLSKNFFPLLFLNLHSDKFFTFIEQTWILWIVWEQWRNSIHVRILKIICILIVVNHTILEISFVEQ